ncbi:MAG: hypothetical protein HWN80_04100 [Candidatus Lokiarchaeota archaeon]|nr:hypothetical protein [Candidatus Lokiarchaeota archaeon]
MSDEYPRLKRFSNRRFSDVISEGFYLFGKNWLTLIVPLGLFFILSLILKNLLVVDLDWQVITMTPAIEAIISKDPSIVTFEEVNLMFDYLILAFFSEFLNSLITSIFNVLAMCLVSNYLYNKFIGKETKLIFELKNALNGRILLVVLLLGVGISVGQILLFIPSIIIFGFYIFYIFTYHSNDSVHPIKEARDLARHAFWKIIGIFLINSLIIFVCDSVYHLIIDNLGTQLYNALWYNPSTRDYGSIIIYDFISNIIQFLFIPLFICLLTSLYVYLRMRREQPLQYNNISQEAPQSYKTPRNELKNNSGTYCAFCGKFMKVKIDFCPHCGEKLDYDIQKE